MNRLTNNDRNLGPFTLARWKNRIGIEYSTGGGDDDGGSEEYRNHITICAFGWALRIKMPNLLKPLMIKVEAMWDEATVKRLGRNHYFNVWPRDFGIWLSNMGNGYDFLQVHYGPRTHDSLTDKTWCKHLPWKQWSIVRHSVYNPDGSHFATENRKKGSFFDFMRKKDECPACHFGFEDYDGEMIVATCIIEEREWYKGEGWFKWLRYFNKPLIRRELDLRFSAEVGTEKGSWKGGTIGHSTNMLPNETPEQAFRRYCDQDHERKGRQFRLRFIGPCDAPPPKVYPKQGESCDQDACTSNTTP